MFSRIPQHRALSRFICGLVFLALWNSAIVWTFCPYLSTRSQCLTEQSHSPSNLTATSRTMSHEHHDDMAMSMTDEEDLVLEVATTTDTKTGNQSITDINPLTTFVDLFPEALTGSQETCTHCMMHSQSGVNSPSTRMVLSNTASEGVAVIASTKVWASLASPVPFVDVHDHGPPGLNSSRYILNSSFRI